MTTIKNTKILIARRILKERGWSYRTAAPLLNVHFTHLYRVLTAERHSRALIARIENLPMRKGGRES